jgi:hypothetical protein
MPKKSSGFNGELLHFGSTRLRITGTGVLRQTLYSLDDVESYTVPTITMSATTNREPVSLTNFIQQRAYLEFKTTAINETFRIDKIVIYVKVVASGYPQ